MPSIPPNYVETSPGVYAHPSRVGALPAAVAERPARQLPKSHTREEAVEAGLEPGTKVGRVVVTRYCRRRIEEHDNLATSYKFFTDAIADRLLPGLPPGRADAF